jgi:hypothetical protein
VGFINVNIPLFNAELDTSFLHNGHPRTTGEFMPVEVFAFTSLNRRCGMFHCMSEMGTLHTRVPIQYLVVRDDNYSTNPLTNYPLDWLQLWDSYGPYVDCIRYEYLKNAAAKIILKNKQYHDATYLMTFDWCYGLLHQTGQSENPGGHKQGHLFYGSGGQLFIQPANRIIWRDGGAWICKELKGNEKWSIFAKQFSCERSGSRWFTSEDNEHFYQFVKNNDEIDKILDDKKLNNNIIKDNISLENEIKKLYEESNKV